MQELNRPWPTIVFEFAKSNENVPQLKEYRDRYLRADCGMNAWVGIKYYENSKPASDTWWMSVVVRDVIRPTPPPNSIAAREPAIVVLGKLPIYPENRYEKLSVMQEGKIWSIPTFILFHPQSIPQLVPPMPQYFDVDVEEWRKFIVSEGAQVPRSYHEPHMLIIV